MESLDNDQHPMPQMESDILDPVFSPAPAGFERDIQAMIARQMEVSRALAAQEDSAFSMICMLSKLSDTVQEQETKISSLEAERVMCHAIVGRLEAKLQSKDTQVRDLEDKVNKQKMEISSLEESLQRMADEVADKNARLRTRDIVIQRLATSLNSAKKQTSEDGASTVSATSFSDNLKQKREARDQKLRDMIGFIERKRRNFVSSIHTISLQNDVPSISRSDPNSLSVESNRTMPLTDSDGSEDSSIGSLVSVSSAGDD